MRAPLILGLCLAAGAAGARAQTPRTDSLDAFVRATMARRHIPALSLAIVQGGRIVYARAYGVTDLATGAPATTATLFQAGSISKPVAALGALQLVEQGKLSLDAPINDYLTSWKVPENAWTVTQKVTLRRLLSHNAGVTVHGFPGYDVAGPIATLVQVLDGAPPANTPPIRVDTTPGAIWRYSGGGITIMQQAMIDVTHEPFPAFMQRTVLRPIGMNASSYEQPPTPARAALTATGYYADRSPVRGRWHVYPEMAAAGLWTTPSDLARFAIEIQQTLAGHGHGVISPAMARQYVTEQKAPSGLGILVSGSGPALRFSHDGRDEGFDANLVGFAGTGDAAAVMIDANDNSFSMSQVVPYIARAYGFPGATAPQPGALKAAPIDPSLLESSAGYYELHENDMLPLVPSPDRTGLITLTDGLPDEDLLPLDSVTFGSTGRPLRIAFVRTPTGEVTGLVWRPGQGRPELHAPRIAPLPSTLTPAPDPDPALTTRIVAALQAVAVGGAELADAPGVTPGAKKDFAGGAPAVRGLRDFTCLGQSDVSGRGIHRHGHDVARVRSYRIVTGTVPSYLFVYLTADGLVTDEDVVAR